MIESLIIFVNAKPFVVFHAIKQNIYSNPFLENGN